MGGDRFLIRNRIENARFVIDELRALGQRPASSRWMQMFRVLERGPIAYGHPDFDIALEADRDFQYMGFVFEQAGSDASDEEFRSKVHKVLKDPVLPQQNLQKSPGRDAQLELFLAAVCQHADLRPVAFEEPDLTCWLWRTKYGIAAKRVKNLATFRDRAKGAVDQIARSRLPGVIFLDLSLSLNRENRPAVQVCSSEQHRREGLLSLRRVFEGWESDIRRWVSGKGVLALVIYSTDLRHHPEKEWGLVGFSCSLQTTWDLESSCMWEQFAGPFFRGFPNQEF